MNHSELTKDQVAELLKRLASDDSFRAKFEAKPAKALHDMGVPAETVVDLNPACLRGIKLASKEVFKEAAEQLEDDVVAAAMAMNVPQLKLSS